jgi:hypothetical protein
MDDARKELSALRKELAAQIETVACSRCGGCGRYSWCSAYGSTCFKCHGKGRVYTKRGVRTHEHLMKLRSVRADQVSPGQFVMEDGVTNGAQPFRGWFRVESVEREDIKIKVQLLFGKSYPLTTWWPEDHLVRVRCTTIEQEIETLKQALEYQATLTKKGEPRKIKEKN